MMGVWSWIFVAVGVLALGYGVYLVITKKPSKEKASRYTLESLQKYALCEGICTIVTGIAFALAGLAYGTEEEAGILDHVFVYISLGILILAIVAEFVLESKICKPIPKKEKK